MITKADKSKPKLKKYMVYLDGDLDDALQKYIRDRFGGSVRVITSTFRRALIMLLKEEGYLDDKSEEEDK